MTIRKKPPLLRQGGLSGRVFVITRYTDPDEKGNVEALEKFDVTDQFEALADERAASHKGDDA